MKFIILLTFIFTAKTNFVQSFIDVDKSGNDKYNFLNKFSHGYNGHNPINHYNNFNHFPYIQSPPPHPPILKTAGIQINKEEHEKPPIFIAPPPPSHQIVAAVNPAPLPILPPGLQHLAHANNVPHYQAHNRPQIIPPMQLVEQGRKESHKDKLLRMAEQNTPSHQSTVVKTEIEMLEDNLDHVESELSINPRSLMNYYPLPSPINYNDPVMNGQKYIGSLDTLANFTQEFMAHYYTHDNSVALQEVMALNCYGCWCNRLSSFGKSKGAPVDNFDKMCQSHTFAYECITMDAYNNRNEVCDPNSLQEDPNLGYKFYFDIIKKSDSSSGSYYDMQITCDSTSNDPNTWCQQRTCEVDAQYIKEFVNLILNGEKLDMINHQQKIKGGNLDFQNDCKAAVIRHMPVKQCCGKYPKRKLFRTDVEDNGYRQCCDIEEGDNSGETLGRVFRPDQAVCCGKHGVQKGGSCELYQ